MKKTRFSELLILTIVAYYSKFFFTTTKLFGNTASRVLLALGPQLNIGLPYKDLYEIVPPGYLVFLSSWVKVFGMSIASFLAIHILLIFLSGYFLAMILRKIIKNETLQLLIFLSTTICVNSFFIQTDLFSIDFFASTLVLGGLAVLLNFKSLILKVSIAASLFFLAGQFKEIYILSFISLIPFYLRELIGKNNKTFFKLLFWSSVGPIAITAILVGYLDFHNIIPDYLEVVGDKFDYKSDSSIRSILTSVFNMFRTIGQFFIKIPNILISLIIANLAIFSVKNWKNFLASWRNLLISSNDLNNYGKTYRGKIILTFTFIAGVLFGTTIYGKYTGVQTISVVTILFILVGILLIKPVELLEKSKLGVDGTRIILAFLLLIIPLLSIATRPYYPVKRNATFKLEQEIIKRVDQDACIFHVYGWEVASTYIYSQRRPCSKYFLVNELFDLLRNDVEEFKMDLVNNPPAAFIYSEGGADINVDKFERDVINIRKVLEKCYTADPKYTNYTKHFFAPVTLYWPNDDLQKEELKQCWSNYGTPSTS